MFFSRSSATFSNDEPTFSFRRLSPSHDDTTTSSPKSDPISSSITSFSAAPTLLIAFSDDHLFFSAASPSPTTIAPFASPTTPPCTAPTSSSPATFAALLVPRDASPTPATASPASAPRTPVDPCTLPLLPPHRPPYLSASALSFAADANDDVFDIGVVVVKPPRPRRFDF